MSKTRLEAFTDGVIAIIITIMVLEVRTPHGTTWAALRQDLPVLLAYVLSFVLIGIYWNNHHHMLAAVTRISGMTLWANQHLLFWLSLIPVATAWMSENHFPPIPVAAYGVVLLAASLAYSVLQATLLRTKGDNSLLAAAIGTDVKGRASNLMYGLGIGLSFRRPMARHRRLHRRSAHVAHTRPARRTRPHRSTRGRRPHPALTNATFPACPGDLRGDPPAARRRPVPAQRRSSFSSRAALPASARSANTCGS